LGELRIPLGELLGNKKIPDVFVSGSPRRSEAQYLGVRESQTHQGKLGSSREHQSEATNAKDGSYGVADNLYVDESSIYPESQITYKTNKTRSQSVAFE